MCVICTVKSFILLEDMPNTPSFILSEDMPNTPSSPTRSTTLSLEREREITHVVFEFREREITHVVFLPGPSETNPLIS
jgi:hypothetical protein